MTDQLALPLAPLVVPDYEPELTIAERFDAFHAANPHVADALELLARQWLDAGHKRVGIKALIERLRWEYGIRTEGDSFRLNNTLTSHYARLLIERRPEWADALVIRWDGGIWTNEHNGTWRKIGRIGAAYTEQIIESDKPVTVIVDAYGQVVA